MRKSFLAAAAVGLSLTLAACGGSSSESTSATSEPMASESSSAPMATGTLTIWVDESRTETFKSIGETFMAETGVSLDVVEKPSADLKNDFIRDAPTGQGPDLIVTANDATGDLVANGLAAPLELGDKSDAFSEAAVRAVSLEGQVYGLPYAIENIGLVRNNAMVQDTPETFAELVEQGRAAEGAEFPIVIQQGGDAGDPYHLYPLQTSFGADVFATDANGDYTSELAMGGPEGEAFAEWLKQMADEDVLSTSIDADKAKQAFLDGTAPYIVTGPWYVADFLAADMDISVLPIPSAGGEPAAPFIGVQAVFMSSQSENQLLAQQFIDFMGTKETQDALYEAQGRTPALTESAEAIDDPIVAGFGEAGANGQSIPTIPEMATVWTYWGGAEVSILNGTAEPVEAWQTMIANIESNF